MRSVTFVGLFECALKDSRRWQLQRGDYPKLNAGDEERILKRSKRLLIIDD